MVAEVLLHSVVSCLLGWRQTDSAGGNQVCREDDWIPSALIGDHCHLPLLELSTADHS